MTEQTASEGMSRWQLLARSEDLKAQGRLLCRVAGKQIALFDTPAGVLACNNQCPHEGYPLSEGSLAGDCLLTCNWHNWKFDLLTGDNAYGGDRLRTYPVDLRGEEIWVDLAEPPFDTRRAEALSGLRAAFDDNSYDRMAREIARLTRIGADPIEALRCAVRWSWQRFEFGWTHAYAGMADWLQLYQQCADDAERQLVCVLEGIAHVADDVLRQPHYSFADGTESWSEEGFLIAIESEDENRAVALVRGALVAGLQFADLERAFSRAALAHYNDFGHSLIYVSKVAVLIERLGAELAEPLLLSLTRGLVYATREDMIPEFRGYASTLRQWAAAASPAAATQLPDMNDWRRRGIDSALQLAAGHSSSDSDSLYDALLGANAANLLAYDIERQDRVRVPVSANIGWLDFTHGITFANAVRKQCGRYPELWPQGLLQMALFSGRNAAYTRERVDLEPWRVPDADEFLHRTVDGLFSHGLGEYIVSVHCLKTTLAVREELLTGVSEPVAEVMAAALNRFLNSPLKRRNPLRTAHQSISFVARE